MEEHLKSVLATMQVKELLDPPNVRKRWTTSRIAVREDGTTIPVLWLLATAKFGTWDPEEVEPYWKDRNWRNETVANVGLISLPLRGSRGKPTKLGIPAGTPEYYRAYRAQNKERVKEYQRRYREKMKEIVRLGQELEGQAAKSPQQTTLESIISELKS